MGNRQVLAATEVIKQERPEPRGNGVRLEFILASGASILHLSLSVSVPEFCERDKQATFLGMKNVCQISGIRHLTLWQRSHRTN